MHGFARPILRSGFVQCDGRGVPGGLQLRGCFCSCRCMHVCSGILLSRFHHCLCRLRRGDVLPRQHNAGCGMCCGRLLVCRWQPGGQRDDVRHGELRHRCWRGNVPLERVCWKLHSRERKLLSHREHQHQRGRVSDGVLVHWQHEQQGRL